MLEKYRQSMDADVLRSWAEDVQALTWLADLLNGHALYFLNEANDTNCPISEAIWLSRAREVKQTLEHCDLPFTALETFEAQTSANREGGSDE